MLCYENNNLKHSANIFFISKSKFLPPERGGKKGISKEKMAEIQSEIEADRRRLEKGKDMAEEEKRKVEQDLAKKESELNKAQ